MIYTCFGIVKLVTITALIVIEDFDFNMRCLVDYRGYWVCCDYYLIISDYFGFRV